MTVFESQIADTLAGAGAGGVQGLALSPLLLLKTRIMTSSSKESPFLIGFEVIRKEGIFSLMKGSGTFALKRVGDWGTRYACTNYFERLIGRETYVKKITAAMLGGLLSAMSTIPLDVLVANLQSASAAGKSASVFAILGQQGNLRDVVAFATRGSFGPILYCRSFVTVVVVLTVVTQGSGPGLSMSCSPPLSSEPGRPPSKISSTPRRRKPSNIHHSDGDTISRSIVFMYLWSRRVYIYK